MDTVHQIQAELAQSARQESQRSGRSHRWESQVLRWCMADPELRVRILRFMDCLPMLKGPADIARHLREYFPLAGQRLPLPLRLGVAVARPGLITANVVAAATRQTATSIARLFLAGGNMEEAAEPIRRLLDGGFQVTLDLLGETTTSQAEADRYAAGYLDVIREWSSLLPCPIHLSLKLSGLAYPFDPLDPEGAWRQVSSRAGSIFASAFERGGFINVDMEHYQLRDLTLTLVQRLLEEKFPQSSSVGVVIQAYLQDSRETTERLLAWVRRRGRPITVRLVRGAYWDSEVIWAKQKSWPCPVYTTKEETDRSFERLTTLLMQNHEQVRIAVGTHNLRSIAHAIVTAQETGVPADRWECQMLYGMSPGAQNAVLRRGIPLRIYTPVGELIPGMAYLVRRILENTSQYSFLASGLE